MHFEIFLLSWMESLFYELVGQTFLCPINGTHLGVIYPHQELHGSFLESNVSISRINVRRNEYVRD